MGGRTRHPPRTRSRQRVRITVTLTVTDDDGATTTDHPARHGHRDQPAPAAAFTRRDGAGRIRRRFEVDRQDGSIACYAWDFGDGARSTDASPSHTYVAGSSYDVTLTVTDNAGGTASVTHSLTVAKANVPPTGAFTATASGLAVAFDGSASADSDGTLASYAWAFGDGSTDTGVSPSHAYAAGGSYTVKLTVTDDKGATGTVSKSITVTAPADQPLAKDDFGRTVAGGFGQADVGGNWTTPSGASNYSVANGNATINNAAGATRSAFLNAVSAVLGRDAVRCIPRQDRRRWRDLCLGHRP